MVLISRKNNRSKVSVLLHIRFDFVEIPFSESRQRLKKLRGASWKVALRFELGASGHLNKIFCSPCIGVTTSQGFPKTGFDR